MSTQINFHFDNRIGETQKTHVSWQFVSGMIFDSQGLTFRPFSSIFVIYINEEDLIKRHTETMASLALIVWADWRRDKQPLNDLCPGFSFQDIWYSLVADLSFKNKVQMFFFIIYFSMTKKYIYLIHERRQMWVKIKFN